MIKLGTYQLLEVEGKTGEGFVVKHSDDDQMILLPNEEVLGQIDVGDSIMAFTYRDNQNNLTATMKESKVTVGELAYLKVVNIIEIGAFFDIGLKRDLFVPKKEINFEIERNKSYLVYCYLDKQERLCGTTRVYDHLSQDHTFKNNDQTWGTIVRINMEVGVFVAVENKYQGMIPLNEYFEKYKEGEKIDLRVIRVRDDKKLDMATRQLIGDQIIVDAEKIYFELNKAGGKLMFHDKSDPEAIKKKFGLSKKAFKRALGKLLKEDKIEIYPEYIMKKNEPNS
ncbi:MAG: S1 RNA-binding domain-containing protein [Clostridia bacterium]|nr:S1 RNA-binding domain-containing protein [Clostridia bacterium]